MLNDETTGTQVTTLVELGDERNSNDTTKSPVRTITNSKGNSRYWMSRNILLGSWMWDYFKFMGEKGVAEQQKKAASDNGYGQGWKMRSC